jgi:tetratricopeptide (TPR) repeat protein
VAFFVPLVPLGRQQIIDCCSACSACQTMPLKKYLVAKEQAIDQATDALATNPDDPGASVGLLHTLTAFNDMEAAYDLATAMESQHEHHADLQFMLAAWHETQELKVESERCLNRAWELEPERLEFRRAMALVLGERGEFGRADELLGSFLPESEQYDSSLFQQMAQYAIDKGEFAICLKFNQIANHNGSLDFETMYRMQVEVCEGALGRKESILKPMKKGWKKLLGK